MNSVISIKYPRHSKIFTWHKRQINILVLLKSTNFETTHQKQGILDRHLLVIFNNKCYLWVVQYLLLSLYINYVIAFYQF